MSYIKKAIKDLISYKPPDYQCKYKMDANEMPFDIIDEYKMLDGEFLESLHINRYPDPYHKHLVKLISQDLGVKPSEVIAGNGSDELINLIVNTFADVGDYILYPDPSFAMYSVYTHISGAKGIPVALDDNFEYDIDLFIKYIKMYQPKITFLCCPNNPTGTVLKNSDIEKIVLSSEGLVVVDEAYFNYYGTTCVKLIEKYDNLIVLRTFSKIGLAGIRLGYMAASYGIIDDIKKTKSPYNVNSLSQALACEVIQKKLYADKVNYLIEEREKMYLSLIMIKGVKAYKSYANFILIHVDNANDIFAKLLDRGILVKSFPRESTMKDFMRITVGKSEENEIFICTLKDIMQNINERACHMCHNRV